MAQTPNSSATAYATPADALTFFSAPFIGNLVNDDKSQATAADLTGNTPAGAVLVALLQAASGYVEAACLKGERYSAADLAALTGVSQQYLKRLVCTLAVGELIWRRDPSKPPPSITIWAETQLQEIASGARVFAFAESEEAGLGVEVNTLTPTPDQTMTGRADRMFGTRAFPF